MAIRANAYQSAERQKPIGRDVCQHSAGRAKHVNPGEANSMTTHQTVRNSAQAVRFRSLLAACAIVSLALICLHSLLHLIELAARQYRYPVLYLDSWTYTHRPTFAEWQRMLGWLTGSHAGHRLVVSRAFSLAETQLLNLPPQSTALLQSLLILLSSVYLIWRIFRKISTSSVLLPAWLACTSLLLSPWQAENFWWEFQTPWLLINLLVLVSVYILLQHDYSEASSLSKPAALTLIIVPWIAIYSSGQGFCLELSLCITALIASRKLGIAVTLSTAAATLAYTLLPSSTNNPTAFSTDFMLSLLNGGNWQPIAKPVVILAATGLLLFADLKRNHHLPPAWLRTLAILGLPFLYSIGFALITTLTRSSLGVMAAQASRYGTPMIMAPISVILIFAWLLEQRISSGSKNGPSAWLALLPAYLVILSILVPSPISDRIPGTSYRLAWQNAMSRRLEIEAGFRCSAQHAIAIIKEKHKGLLAGQCRTVDPAAGEAIKYLTGKKPLKPRGWHLDLLTGQNQLEG